LLGIDATLTLKEKLCHHSLNDKEKLRVRLTTDIKRTLQAAAMASHRSVSAFVLESALARAGEVLADRRTFGLNPARWKAFIAALDAPPPPGASSDGAGVL